MMEVLATLTFLFIGGVCLAFLAVCGLLLAGLLKLAFFPITIAFDIVKFVVMFIVVPVIVFIVIPIVLFIVVPVVFLVLVPLLIGLAILAFPLMIFGVFALAAVHAI